MDIKYLNYVLTIAKEKNLHLAADKLYISQPSLSYYLNKLESELGTPLFYRTSKGLSLTEAGRLYVETAQTAVNMRNKLYRDIENLSYQSHLSIAATSSWGMRLLGSVIPRFKSMYPDTLIEVSETYFPQMLSRLNNQEVDICLASVVDMEDINYNILVLGEEENVMVIPAGHPLCQALKGGAEEIDLDAIPRCFAEDYFLFTSKGSTSRQLAENAFNALHFYPKIYGYFDNVILIRRLVASGTGVAFLPATSILPPVDDVVQLSVKPKILRKHILAYRKNLVMTQAVKDLFDMTLDTHASMPLRHR